MLPRPPGCWLGPGTPDVATPQLLHLARADPCTTLGSLLQFTGELPAPVFAVQVTVSFTTLVASSCDGCRRPLAVDMDAEATLAAMAAPRSLCTCSGSVRVSKHLRIFSTGCLVSSEFLHDIDFRGATPPLITLSCADVLYSKTDASVVLFLLLHQVPTVVVC